MRKLILEISEEIQRVKPSALTIGKVLQKMLKKLKEENLVYVIYVENIKNPNPNRKVIAKIENELDAKEALSAFRRASITAPLYYTLEKV